MQVYLDEEWTGPPETYWTRLCYTREPKKCGIYPITGIKIKRCFYPQRDPCQRPLKVVPEIDCCAPVLPNTKTTHEINILNIKVNVEVKEVEKFEPRQEGEARRARAEVVQTAEQSLEPPTGLPLEHPCTPSCPPCFTQPYCPPVYYKYPLAPLPCPPPCNAPHYDPCC